MASRNQAILDPSKPSSPLSIAPSRTALLLMDFQNLTLSFVPENERQIINIARQTRDWALAKGMMVFHCLIDTKSGTEPEPFHRISERWPNYKEKLNAMPSLGDEPSELAPVGRDNQEVTVVRTPGLVSALQSRGVEEALRQMHIDSLILCGISTSGCVLSTCRAATDAGYIVTVLRDACFDPVSDLHNMLMANVIPATAHVTTTEELQLAFSAVA